MAIILYIVTYKFNMIKQRHPSNMVLVFLITILIINYAKQIRVRVPTIIGFLMHEWGELDMLDAWEQVLTCN